MEFGQLQAEVRQERTRSPEQAETHQPALAGSLDEELSRLAGIAPGAAIAAADHGIEDARAQKSESASPGSGPMAR